MEWGTHKCHEPRRKHKSINAQERATLTDEQLEERENDNMSLNLCCVRCRPCEWCEGVDPHCRFEHDEADLEQWAKDGTCGGGDSDKELESDDNQKQEIDEK